LLMICTDPPNAFIKCDCKSSALFVPLPRRIGNDELGGGRGNLS
jgi:hypothetical protein